MPAYSTNGGHKVKGTSTKKHMTKRQARQQQMALKANKRKRDQKRGV